MREAIFRITATLLFLFGIPAIFPAAARPNSEKANDHVLIFVGSARKHLQLKDSIDAALHDAARKVAFYHSVSGEVVTHESSGALVGNNFITHSEINDSGDYVRYLDKLEYNNKTDVFESDDTIFVHAGYRSTSKINIDYTRFQNNEKPWWIDNPPSKIGSYLAVTGFSAKRLYHNDTVVASYENAVITLIESSAIKIGIIESETVKSNNMSSLSISSGTLTGFFVLDTWTDPITKSVWTLAIASGFTENKAVPYNSVFDDISDTPFPYQYIPVQFVSNFAIPDNWTTHKPDDTETTVYFWGFSKKCNDLQEAQRSAEEDARLRISFYISGIVEGKQIEVSRYLNKRGFIVQDSEIFNTSSLSYTQTRLRGINHVISSSPILYSNGSMEIQILVSISKENIEIIRDEVEQKMNEPKPPPPPKPRSLIALSNIFFGLGFYIDDDLVNGLAVTSGYLGASGLILWEIYGLKYEDPLAGKIGPIGAVIGGLSLLYGIARPIIQSINPRFAYMSDNINIDVVSAKENNTSVHMSYKIYF